MLIREIMKRNPSCISQSATIDKAAQMMEQIGCGILPVVSGEAQGQYSKNPIGVLTDRDLAIRCIAQGRDPRTTTVGEVCTLQALACHEDEPIAQAFETLRKHGVGRLLVQDEGGKLCGIVTLADILARGPRDVWERMSGVKEPKPRNKIAA